MAGRQLLELSMQHLLDLYKIAIDEYRFQVKLNWDRTAYHLTLNSGLIAVAVGLLKIGSTGIVNLFVAGVFFIGLLLGQAELILFFTTVRR